MTTDPTDEAIALRVIITPSLDDAGRIAAALIRDRILSGRLKSLGVATGSSPLAIYRHLARLDPGIFVGLTVFALDEYVGIAPSHPQSYARFVQREIAGPLGLDTTRVHVPDGDPARLSDAGTRYEAAISAAGGIDLQILGIGRNGHIGFNEPGSSLSSRTRVKTLAEETLRDNRRFFGSDNEVPPLCVTQGLGTIGDARELLMIAGGDAKAAAIAWALEGPVSSTCPGSLLQLHPTVTVLVDEAAAALLSLSDYHRLARARELDLADLGARDR